jgi:hypothetical protein
MLAAMPFAVAGSFQATVYAVKNRDKPEEKPAGLSEPAGCHL